MTNDHIPINNVQIQLSLTDSLRVLSVNGDVHNLLGFTNDDFLTNKACLKSLIHADDQDIAEQLFSSEDKRLTERFNIRIRHSDGRIRCIVGSVSKTKHNNGTTANMILQDAKSISTQQPALKNNPYFVAMMQNTDDFIYFKDRNHVFIGASQTLVTITSPTEHWTDLLHKTDYDVFPEAYADIYYKLEKMVFSGIKIAHEIQKTIDIHGNHGWVDNRKYPIYNDQNQITGLFGIARDITDQIKREEYDKFRNLILEKLAKNTPICDIFNAIAMGIEKINPIMRCSILLVDETGKHLQVGAAPSLPNFFNEIIDGIEIGENAGSCGGAVLIGKQVVVEDISTHPFWQYHTELTSRAGVGACWSQPIFSASNQTLGALTLFYRDKHIPADLDITIIEQSARLIGIAIEHEKTRLEIQQLAFYDTLTKLANRRLLFDRLTLASIASLRTGRYGCVLFIDLDNFKGINDTLGHDYGDLLLQQVAKRLLDCVRAIDTVARLGGDEFIIMVESLADNSVDSIKQVTLIANKVLAKIGQIYQLGEYEYHVTPSIGATLFGTEIMSAESLIKQADAAMYQAKTSGKNKLDFYQQAVVNDA